MKKIFIISSAFLVFTACNSNTEKNKTEAVISSADSATATESASRDTGNKTEAPVDSATMMKAWTDYMTPGDEHKMLAQQAGNWKEEITMWMNEGAPARKYNNTGSIKMISNGLYQESTHKGNMDGMAFEGRSTMGYDKAKKKFVSSWIDNMGSGIVYMEGTYDSANKMITMMGNMTDPVSGKMVDTKETMTTIDDKTIMLEMYETRNGKERKTMEIKMSKM